MDLTTPGIRARRVTDVAACVRVLRAVHEQLGYPVNWPDDPAEWLACDRVWVAVLADGTVCGQVAVTVDGSEALVERLFVDPAYTGAGIGRALLRHGLREARTIRSRVFLDVVGADDAANGLYRAEGWTEAGRTPIDWAGPAAELVRYRAPEATGVV